MKLKHKGRWGWGIYGLNGWGILWLKWVGHLWLKWVGHLWLKWMGQLVTVFGRYAQNEYWSSGEYPFRSSHDHGFQSIDMHLLDMVYVRLDSCHVVVNY